MNRFTVVLPLLLAVSGLAAQAFNTVLRDQLTYSQDLNDVWGYVAPDGTEYALVGTRTGLSIVSLADPDNLVEVDFVSGDASTWRDIKTFGEYAYVVADQGNDGVVVVDLSNLPGAVSSQQFVLNVTGGSLAQAHNIYIDETTGLAYLAGADRNSGGMVILDIGSVPGQVTFEAFAPNTYAHDVYVQDGRMYASEINAGDLHIYDVSDVQNITSIGSVETPLAFTHNAWSTADGNYVFTTDERPNAPTAVYDITDPSSPELIAEFYPPRSRNTGTVPHNAHVLGDYVIISNYTDGVEIVDASVPSNPIEVAYYDTFSGANGGFNGTWGAYPFLPSGLVLATDIDNGLFVVEVDYQLAARIKGTVTEGDFTGPNLNNVSVSITDPTGATTATNAAGFYQSGFPYSGTYTVTFSLPGYNDVVASVDFASGVEVVLDTFLTLDAASSSAVQGRVNSIEDGSAIADVQVILEGPDATYNDISDVLGKFGFAAVLHDNYLASVGKWGFENQQSTTTINGSTDLAYVLTPGYLDGFVVDQGWTTGADASTSSGFWVRAEPVGTTLNGNPSNPGADTGGPTDIGSQAYITGNGGGTAGTDDIDGGAVTLISPMVDLTFFPNVNDVAISYDYWFINGGGSSQGDDQMTVTLSNGVATEVIATYTIAESASEWVNVVFQLSDLSIPLTNTLQVIVEASDYGSGHVVEAGFDDFRVFENIVLPVELTYFSARKNGPRAARLDWATGSESGNAGFDVERSKDGRVFTTIGQVTGAGDSRNEVQYAFTDQAPHEGLNYYRLRQRDHDGRTALSEVRTLFFGESPQETSISIFPNPSDDLIRIDNQDPTVISIYNVHGVLLQRQSIEAGAPIDIRRLPAGQYWLQSEAGSAGFTKR